MLQEFYSQMKVDQEKSQLEVVPKKDKLKIVETAAKLIRDDIKALQTSHRAYPACDELGSDDSINFLSESLKILLEGLIMGKDVQTQIASTGQALMQSARPRVLLAPLQIGLGVQLHQQHISRHGDDSHHKP